MNRKVLLFLSLIIITSCKTKENYYQLPTFSSNGFVNAVVEIPAGTSQKIEYKNGAFKIDQENGKDRIINFLPYPGNYGFIPSTFSDPEEGGDGDALDVLVIAEAIPTGSITEIIPLGILKLIDDGELDYKIIANVAKPSEQIIQANNYQQLTNNYPQIKNIIELWFMNYNSNDPTLVVGWENETEAIKEIENNLR